MGKSKKQYEDLERLEKELKEQKSINRSLKRKLKKKDRDASFEESEEKEEPIQYEEPKNRCPTCKKGTLKLTELGIRLLEVCSNICGYRKVIKK